MTNEAVNHPLQPYPNRPLGEGVDNQRDSRCCKAALGRVPERQELRQETDGQLVQLQSQRDQSGVDERGPDDDTDAEQVRGEDGIADGSQEQYRGKRTRR